MEIGETRDLLAWKAASAVDGDETAGVKIDGYRRCRRERRSICESVSDAADVH